MNDWQKINNGICPECNSKLKIIDVQGDWKRCHICGIKYHWEDTEGIWQKIK